MKPVFYIFLHLVIFPFDIQNKKYVLLCLDPSLSTKYKYILQRSNSESLISAMRQAQDRVEEAASRSVYNYFTIDQTIESLW